MFPLKNNKLKLTEREIEIILFLKKQKNPININVLQKEVWGYAEDSETHTVETHVYRLRKKLKKLLMTKILFKVTKKDILYSEKKNFIAKDLMTPKYKPRVIKPKKGKGVLKEKKII